MDIKGKKALVFGGTSGIGLATVQALATGGASVVAISRDPDRAKDAVPSGVMLKQCDVRDRDGLATLFADSAPYDIIISAATGGERAVGPFLQMEMDGFQGAFDKLWGYANVVRFGTEGLADDGCIVIVSGTPARKPKPGQIAIGAVGAAVENFARMAALEMAPKRLNVVSPGIIDTPLFGPESEQRTRAVQSMTSGHPIARGGTASEVAQGIMFMVENDFVTGTTIDVDGGWILT
jgi:NAD(P)-dependent dehydrogenase (short-subunit alcohol dehydrogenase family)